MSSIYQLHISLNDTDPSIWRRLYVPADILLSHLHTTIQLVMGWEDSHLHSFVHNRKFYGIVDPYDEMGTIDYTKVRLNDLLKRKGSTLIYEYDYGDSWEHTVLLEDSNVKTTPIFLPYCIEGEHACPPEDCGGIPGYESLVRIMANPDDDEYDEMVEWLGKVYDPKAFYLDDINIALQHYTYL